MLWTHQQQAVDFAHDKVAAALWMGMGTGKTRCALELAQQHRYVLVVCPKIVIPVWRMQVEKHYPVFPLQIWDEQKGTCKGKGLTLTSVNGPLMAVINYDAIWRPGLREAVNAIPWEYIICDESHRIKSASGKASRFLHNLKRIVKKRHGHTPRRLCLSGTPLPHSPLDAYAQYRFLDQSIFGRTKAEFVGRYGVKGGFEGREIVRWINQELFTKKFQSIAYQVRTADVLDLPPYQDHWIRADLEPKARRIYRDLEKELVAILGDDYEQDIVKAFLGGEDVATAANPAVLSLRLQQVTGGFLKTEEKKIVPVSEAKKDLLASWLEDLAPTEPVVIFYRFAPEALVIHEVCTKLKRVSLELSGRVNELPEWQDNGAPILAVQIQAGGIGVDLTRARYACYWSTGWSLGDYEQSRARLHRPGQERSVYYCHLGINNSVDGVIQKALEKREQLVRRYEG